MTGPGFEFLHPMWLLLLPLVLAWPWWWRGKDTGSGGAGRRFLHPLVHLLATTPASAQRWRWLWRSLTALGLASLVVALAEPVTVGERIPEPPVARDIVLVLDTSVSMVLRDYSIDGKRVDRMSVLKGLLDPFVAGLSGARISVVVFGDEAYTLVPLTRDTALAREMVKRVRIGIAGRYSALGEAIALGVREVGDAPEHRRFLVVFTDTDLATGNIEPEAAAELAAEAGVRLYTVAVGATDMSAAEETLSGLIYAPVNMALLERLADATGGTSLRARDTESVREAIDIINRQEQHELENEPLRWTWPL